VIWVRKTVLERSDVLSRHWQSLGIHDFFHFTEYAAQEKALSLDATGTLHHRPEVAWDKLRALHGHGAEQINLNSQAIRFKPRVARRTRCPVLIFFYPLCFLHFMFSLAAAPKPRRTPPKMISNLLNIPVVNPVGVTICSGALAPVPVLFWPRTSILVYLTGEFVALCVVNLCYMNLHLLSHIWLVFRTAYCRFLSRLCATAEPRFA
jgi:hypothetical protein